ncbi:hypothetical protein D3C78_416860 [compost metagenome]
MITEHITCTLNRCQAILDGLESGRDTIQEPRGARRLLRISKRAARFVMASAYVQGEFARAHQTLSRVHRLANGGQ